MKTFRSTFEENYKAVPEPCDNKKGFKMRYVYIGLWYVWNLPSERVRATKRMIGMACAFNVLLFFAGSLLDSPLNYDRYVSLFGMLSIAALVFEVFGTVQFCLAKEKMTNMDFQDIQTKMMIAPLAHAILLLCAVAAAVWQLLFYIGSEPFFPISAYSEGEKHRCGYRLVFLTKQWPPWYSLICADRGPLL